RHHRRGPPPPDVPVRGQAGQRLHPVHPDERRAMTGLHLGRQLALLGAEFAVAPPEGEAANGADVRRSDVERWRALGQQMRAHLASGEPSVRRLRDELGLSEVSYWLTMLCAAVEVFPDAAAAISLLAEDERVHLVTPLSFARLLSQSLGLP